MTASLTGTWGQWHRPPKLTQRCQHWTEDSSQTAANGLNAQIGTRAPKQKVCVDGVTLAVCVIVTVCYVDAVTLAVCVIVTVCCVDVNELTVTLVSTL